MVSGRFTTIFRMFTIALTLTQLHITLTEILSGMFGSISARVRLSLRTGPMTEDIILQR